MLAVLLLAVIASIVGHHWYATSDWAVEVLRIREVGTSHTPLVGAYSRLGFAHPGPLPFWLLAGFERPFGETGILVGTALLNITSLGLALWVARRHGGNRLLLLLWLGEIGLVHGLGIDFLVDPWNPHVPVLPFLAYLLLLWGVVVGDPPLIPLAVFAGSFALQAHVGYAPLVIGLGGLAAGCAWVRRRRAIDEPTPTPPVATARRMRWGYAGLVIGLLLWIAPVWQQLFDDPGNLAAIIDSLRNPVGSAAGLPYALGVMGTEAGPLPAWLTGSETAFFAFVKTSRAWPAVLIISAAAALAAAVRRRRPEAGALAVGAVAAVVLALVATSRVTGGVVPYLVRWWWPVLMLTYVAVAWCAVELVAPLVVPRIQRFSYRIAGVAAVGCGLLVGVSGLPVELPLPIYGTPVATLAGPTAAGLDHHKRYLVVAIDSGSLGATAVGLLTELEDRGYQVFFDRRFTLALSKRRVIDPARADASLAVVSGEDDVDWKPPLGSRRLATYDPVPAANRREARALQTKFRRLLGKDAGGGPIVVTSPGGRAPVEGHGARAADIDRLAEIQARGDAYSVYLVPAAKQP